MVFVFQCIVMLCCKAHVANANDYGLQFKGVRYVLDERTGLNLSPNSFLAFEKEFEISFDFKLDNFFESKGSTFGYIMRLINKDDVNVDLLCNIKQLGRLNLVLGSSKRAHIFKDFSKYDNKWINLRLKFNLEKDQLTFYTPDSFFVYNDIGFKNKDAFKMLFGANDYSNFKTTDVPSINIRDLKVFEKGVLLYHWPLNLKKGNMITDKVKGKRAIVNNPSWLLFSYQSWVLETSQNFEAYVVLTYDDQNERFILIGKNNYHTYSLSNGVWQSYPYNNTPSFLITNERSHYRIEYNNKDDLIYCYTTDIDWPIYTFDLKTNNWSGTGYYTDYFTEFRHHNSFYNANKKELYVFGGYGNYTYNNNVRRINLVNGDKLELPTNDSIFLPRYLAGSFQLNDTVYIMGGYGSKSGSQLINPVSYYDLIGYSIKSGSFTKIAELPKIIEDMVVAKTMWVDSLTRNYYGLIYKKSVYNGKLKLVKGNIDKPEMTILGDDIPFKFHDMKSNIELFYSKKQNKLIAYTTYFSGGDTTKLSIRSINYPPSKFVNTDLLNAKEGERIWVVFACMVLFVAVVFYMYSFNKKSTVVSAETLYEDDENDAVEIIDIEDDKKSEYVLSNHKEETERYQVTLFGEFQAFDKNNIDITNKFSPLVKELFLLILLYTYKNNKGISIEKLTEIIWHNEPEKSARNKSSVYIAKLRMVLSELGDWQLSEKNGSWKVVNGRNNVKCDYTDFNNITNSVTKLTKEKVLRLMQIANKGTFLFNMQNNWVEEFKALVSDKIIDALVEFAAKCNVEKEPELIINIANTIFNFDMVSEDAIRLKCRAEYYMGKHNDAKSSYEKFLKEYKLKYGQDYSMSFIEVLNLSI